MEHLQSYSNNRNSSNQGFNSSSNQGFNSSSSDDSNDSYDSFETFQTNGSPVIGIKNNQVKNLETNSRAIKSFEVKDLIKTENNEPLNRKLFSDSNNSNEITNKKSKFIKMFLIIFGVVIFIMLIAIPHNHMRDSSDELVLRSFNIDDVYPTTLMIKSYEPIDWWIRYSNNCCVKNFNKLLNNTHKTIHHNTDCSADDNCRDFIDNWLLDNNQFFYNSSWSQQCCYEYRSIGSKYYKSFCSYVCLNSQRQK